ncbi:ABC transporter substrate-binding protein [Rhodococcoides yunnanense]|uniref:ABC transporter substrate-binding protein n=1 Tax=Rhodococcoides yunnanense TaxID=278209 RepID=UPI00093436E5|nr:ABC transporter substrate-binding protein [Rhodococcus yunnanensis]
MPAKNTAVRLLALVFATTVALTGCASDEESDTESPGDAAQPFRVTFIASVSGPLAPFAIAHTAAVKAAAGVINDEGGILGRQVEVTIVDDGGEATKAVNAAQSIVNEDVLPDVVIPGNFSASTIPVLPIFARADIPTVSIATASEGNDPEKYPLNFGVSNTPAQSMKGLTDYLKEEGIASIAVVAANNETGRSTLATLEQNAEAEGISITDSQSLDSSTVDATAALSKLQSSNPEALVVIGLGGALPGTVFKDRTKLGWDIPTITDVTTTSTDLVTLAGGSQNLNNVVEQELHYAVVGDPLQATDAFGKFLPAYLEQDPKPGLPMGALAAGWGAMSLIQGAFDAAGSTDPDEFKSAAESLTTEDAPLWFQTPGPSLGLSPDNHYVDYGSYVYAPAGPRDSTGSLTVAAE